MAFSLKRPNSNLPRVGVVYAVLFGIIAAIGMILITALTQEYRYKTDTIVVWIAEVALFLLMVICCLSYRKNEISKHYLNTRQAYMMCVYVGLVASVIFSALLLVYVAYIDSGFMQRLISSQEQMVLMNTSLTEVVKVERIQLLHNLKVEHVVMNAFGEIVLVSVMVPLILSLFVRSER
ncbi:MAG: DUF4199 domain-containing protein [Bacteroidales bacterium]